MNSTEVYFFFFGPMITDKKAACAAVGGFFKGDRKQRLTQLECAVECCTSDDCNKDIIPVLQTGTLYV